MIQYWIVWCCDTQECVCWTVMWRTPSKPNLSVSTLNTSTSTALRGVRMTTVAQSTDLVRWLAGLSKRASHMWGSYKLFILNQNLMVCCDTKSTILHQFGMLALSLLFTFHFFYWIGLINEGVMRMQSASILLAQTTKSIYLKNGKAFPTYGCGNHDFLLIIPITHLMAPLSLAFSISFSQHLLKLENLKKYLFVNVHLLGLWPLTLQFPFVKLPLFW